MRFTQHEIVHHLGISRGTLYRVLTDSSLVRPETKRRVLRELERLEYIPNAIARGLKTRKTHCIGIVGPAAIRQANIDKVNALHVAAWRKGYSIILGYSDGSSEEDARCIRELRSRMVDGFIVLGRGLPQSAPHYQSLLEAKIPLVTLYPISGLEADCVHVDTLKGFYELTSHLVSLGHVDIGLLLNGSRSQYTAQREAGFRQAMAHHRMEVREEWIVRASPAHQPPIETETDEKRLWKISDYQCGFDGAAGLLKGHARPTALVCSSDEFALGALRAADLAGVAVPDDLALVGYDNREEAKFARVPLTTMQQPDEELATAAIDLLTSRIEEGPAQSSICRVFPSRLVIRESCGGRIKRG